MAGALWVIAVAVAPRSPAAPVWLVAPAFAAATMVLHRVVVSDATRFFGWAAALLAGVGFILILISSVGQRWGFPTDALGFWGLGLIGPSHVLFGLGLTRLARPLAVAGMAIVAGWCLPLVTLVVSGGAIVWTALGSAWILFALANIWALRAKASSP
jgi:hypothetical protein